MSGKATAGVEYTVTWSRQGLIGVTAHRLTTNRFASSKAAKTPPSRIVLIKTFDWMAVDLSDTSVWGSYRRRVDFAKFVTDSDAL